MEHLENLQGKIAAVSMQDIILAVLKDEIELYKSRIEPQETGYLHTTIGTLKHRIEELENDIAISSRKD
jgi:hypothetical protein